MKLVIACDHAGCDVKEAIIADLKSKGHEVKDFGCDGTASVNYPDYAHLVCKAVQDKEAELGILVCGTGIGMSMAANKHAGIRAAVCTEEFSAEMTRRHNDANVLCMGARVISAETAVKLSNIFVETPYEGGRHAIRVALVDALDKTEKI